MQQDYLEPLRRAGDRGKLKTRLVPTIPPVDTVGREPMQATLVDAPVGSRVDAGSNPAASKRT